MANTDIRQSRLSAKKITRDKDRQYIMVKDQFTKKTQQP